MRNIRESFKLYIRMEKKEVSVIEIGIVGEKEIKIMTNLINLLN